MERLTENGTEPRQAASSSRRELFALAAAGVAALARSAHAAPPGLTTPPGGPLGSAHGAAQVVSGGPLSPALLRALVERCCYGFDAAEWQLAQALGPVAYLEHHLDPDAIDDSALDALLAPLGSLQLSAQQIVDAYDAEHPSQPLHEFKHAAILRAVHSRRQLLERMVEFWSDHFSMRQDKETVRYLKLVDDREVIRPFALGRFRDLLSASMHSPAMLAFLDNDSNSKTGPNENYARELMELHTLGVDGGYTEGDVKQAARCLTGWRFVPWNSVPFGVFVFAPKDHDPDEKHVLGAVLPAGGGQQDGETLLDLLASHPSTARHVGKKLAHWLLCYEPPEALVDELVASWTHTDGDIRALVRVILAPKWLEATRPDLHRKLRRPFHFVTGLLRTLRAQIAHPASYDDPAPLEDELRVLGQLPFEWFAADGYPDTENAWASSLQPRWSFASRLLDGTIEGVTLDTDAITQRLIATGTTSPGEAVSALLCGASFADADVAALDAFSSLEPPAAWPPLAELLALGASTPSYQRF